MRIIISLLSAVCILSFSSSALAKTKHAPLPQQILQAKTVYIDNQSGLAYIGDRAYDEVSKWGRFKIVNPAKDADVVFLLSAAEYVSGYRTDTDSTTRGTVDDSGNVQLNTDSTARTRAQTSGVTFLTVLNPKNGAALWSNQKTWGSGLVGLAFARSATRSLVKELRKRIEEQEADSKKVGEVDSAPGANTPEANAMVAEQYLAMTPDGGMGLTRAIAWRMAKTYPEAWQKIGGDLVNETLKSCGIGVDLQTLVGAVQEMRQAVQKDDGEGFGKAAGKLLGVPKREEKSEGSIVNDLLKSKLGI